MLTDCSALSGIYKQIAPQQLSKHTFRNLLTLQQLAHIFAAMA